MALARLCLRSYFAIKCTIARVCLFTPLGTDAFHNSFGGYFSYFFLHWLRGHRTHNIRTFNIISFIHFYAFISPFFLFFFFSLFAQLIRTLFKRRAYVYFMNVYVYAVLRTYDASRIQCVESTISNFCNVHRDREWELYFLCISASISCFLLWMPRVFHTIHLFSMYMRVYQ